MAGWKDEALRLGSGWTESCAGKIPAGKEIGWGYPPGREKGGVPGRGEYKVASHGQGREADVGRRGG